MLTSGSIFNNWFDVIWDSAVTTFITTFKVDLKCRIITLFVFICIQTHTVPALCNVCQFWGNIKIINICEMIFRSEV